MNIQNNCQQNCAKRSNYFFPTHYNVDKIFYTILYSLCLALSLISFIWDIDALIKVNASLGMFAFILLSTRIRREYAPIYIYIGCLSLSFIVSSLFVGRTGWRLINPIYFIITSLGPAMILLRRYVYSWGGYVVFYGLAGYFIILMLIGVDGHSALKYCSFNGISEVMLVACISLYIILSVENKKIDFKPALCTLVISIWGIGRSGIASSLVLLLGLLFVGLGAKPKLIYHVIIYLFIACLLYAASLLVTDHSIFKNAVDHYLTRKMATGPSERWTMWTNYFNNLDISRIIFGVNVVEDPWPAGLKNEYNYHNSFIHLHLQTGFMGLITVALIFLSILKFYKTNQILLLLWLTLLLRSSTDSVLFFGRFDFIPFFFIFYYLRSVHFSIPHVHPHFLKYQRARPGIHKSEII